MADEIVNRVANSKLVSIDLEDLYPKGERVSFDIAPWLYEGLILKEKDFREAVDGHDWSQYRDNYIALICSVDAIIPSWAYLLLTTKLAPYAKEIVIGNLELLETVIFKDIIDSIEIDIFKDKPVILKGCANKPIPETAYSLLIRRLQPYVKSIMYGEACSTVPLFKEKK